MYRPSYHLVTIVLMTFLAATRSTGGIRTADNYTTVNRSSGEARRAAWRGKGGVALCRDFPGLSRDQMATCLRHPAETAAALMGLRLAVAECQFQFRWHRWNCSSLRSAKSRNPHSTALLHRGYRESAFAYAISAAGVMHAVSRACSLGRLSSCGCGGSVGSLDELEDPEDPWGTDPDDSVVDDYEHDVFEPSDSEESEVEWPMSRKRRSGGGGGSSGGGGGGGDVSSVRGQWQWGGCSHNLQFGARFSELFLDSRELRGRDLQSRINLHNNRAGRLAVVGAAQVRCKCHGLSGSCEVRTCWRAAPEFRRVGEVLQGRFRAALLVDQGNLGRRGGVALRGVPGQQHEDNSLHSVEAEKLRGWSRRRQRHVTSGRGQHESGHEKELLYFQRSPSFCESSPDFPGTSGRRCHKNSSGMDGCASLCCGRGYNVLRQRRSERCFCRFHWCCQVVCKNCTVEEWITECK